MALILAWTLLFPIFSFLGCFSLCSASAEDNAFHFDTEESSAHGSQDNSLLRGQQQAVAFASWSHFAEVQSLSCLLTFLLLCMLSLIFV